MIPFEEAHRIVIENAKVLDTEKNLLTESLGRHLAVNIFADEDAPRFDKSAMDGYAVRWADLQNDLEIIEVIAAGSLPKHQLTEGKCSKIMTGAPVPKGADAVIMIEDTELTPEGKMRYTLQGAPNSCDPKPQSTNIRYRGEDSRKGDLVISKGSKISPQHIAILAGVGISYPEVYRKVRVGIIATGSELVELHETPGPGQIRNTNSPQIQAQVNALGLNATYYGIATDDLEKTKELVKEAKDANDVIIMSGGVSKGDFDYVPEVIESLGFDIKFRAIAVQPGKPTLFGVDGIKYCFGLPGNPVSSFMQFELIVRPFLNALSGQDSLVKRPKYALGEPLTRKKGKRLAWIPMRFENNALVATNYNGSGHINALANADALAAFKVGVTDLEEGELVEVALL